MSEGPMIPSNVRWEPVGCCFESEPIDVAGINPWNFEWHSLGSRVELFHPAYRHQPESMWFYWVSGPLGKPVVFAARELSAGVWGFFVPENPITD
jgi:hypothetical protein